MIHIDTLTVQKTAHLARLDFSDPDALEAIKADMSQILDWMQMLQDIDTKDVQPLIHISTELNVLRADIPALPLSHQQALAGAPRHDSDYFRVPKVIE